MKGKNDKVNFTPTPFTFLDLPDYDWEKRYKEDCEFIRNMSIKYGPDEKDYGDFFIPKAVYIPTEMPLYMREMYPVIKPKSTDSSNDKLDNTQMYLDKFLLRVVYNGYLYLIDSAKSRGDEELGKELRKNTEDILLKIKRLEEGKLK